EGRAARAPPGAAGGRRAAPAGERAPPLRRPRCGRRPRSPPRRTGNRPGMDRIRTAGHGALSAEELARLLREAGIDLVVDVRRYPGSRRHPQFAAEAMGAWLPGAGIEYLWLPELGGRRKVVPGSPHHALRNEQFRAYADHMASDEFATGLERLREAASDRS